MKASLSATGKLTIFPETDLEEFALKKWLEDYEREEGRSVLEIAVQEIAH